MTVARFLNHSLEAILKSHGQMEGANPTCQMAFLLGDSRFKAGAGSDGQAPDRDASWFCYEYISNAWWASWRGRRSCLGWPSYTNLCSLGASRVR
jgi:hypothetical protein